MQVGHAIVYYVYNCYNMRIYLLFYIPSPLFATDSPMIIISPLFDLLQAKGPFREDGSIQLPFYKCSNKYMFMYTCIGTEGGISLQYITP